MKLEDFLSARFLEGGPCFFKRGFESRLGEKVVSPRLKSAKFPKGVKIVGRGRFGGKPKGVPAVRVSFSR